MTGKGKAKAIQNGYSSSVRPSSPSIYHELKDNNIRLLRIHAGHRSDVIECTMTVEDFEDDIEFEALSYVWGTTMATKSIILNDVPVKVKQNLYNALEHLRPSLRTPFDEHWHTSSALHSSHNVWRDFASNQKEDRNNRRTPNTAIWIDALCINQDDLEERASQVKLMGHIYERAALVMIWFGNEDVPSYEGDTRKSSSWHFRPRVHDIKEYGNIPIVLLFIAQALRNLSAPPNRLAQLKSAEDFAHRNLAYGFPSPHDSTWSTVSDFFFNDWFRRAWVVQEIIAAQRAVVIVGNWEIEWNALGKAASWFKANDYARPRVSRSNVSLESQLPVDNAAVTWELSQKSDIKPLLLDLLKEFRNRRATMAVDRVYAALGIAKETKPGPSQNSKAIPALLEPDYTRPVKDVYRDTARFLVIEHRNLLVLSHAGAAFRTPEIQCSSWVPNWHTLKLTSELSTPSNYDSGLYNADFDEPLDIRDTLDANTLLVHGIDADIVQKCGATLSSQAYGYETVQEELSSISGSWKLFKEFSNSTAAEIPYAQDDMFTVFVSTLTARPLNNTTFTQDGFNVFEDAALWFSQHLSGRYPLPVKSKLPRWARSSIPDGARFHDKFVRTCVDRRFFITQKGFMGIGPEAVQDGDKIAILFGGKVPYVLRMEDGKFELIGECFVAGLMEGEAVTKWKSLNESSEVCTPIPDAFEII
jgi:hypothetical protein